MQEIWLHWISYVDLAAILVLLVRLARNGLFRKYRFFYAYLSADILETLLGLVLREHRKLYAEIYLAGQSAKMLLGVFVVLEIYQIALAGHPALARFGRETVRYVLVAAAALASFGLMLDNSIPAGRSPILHRFNSFERTMDAALLLFLLMIAAFMSWFPVRMTRNGLLYIAGFVVYFLARSLGLLLSNVAPSFIQLVDMVMLTVAIGCLFTWIFALRREGEKTIVVVGHRWDPIAMDRLSGQLDGINSRLVRFSRR